MANDDSRRAHDAQLLAPVSADVLKRLSHDLRTPLNIMLGYAQLLQVAADDRAGDLEAIAEILKAGRQMARLIDEAHDLAHLDAGTLSVRCSAQPVLPIVTAALQAAAPLLDSAATIALEVRTAAPSVFADRTHLMSSIVALVLAAARFNRSRGELKLRIDSGGDLVGIVVAPAVDADAAAMVPPRTLDRAPDRTAGDEVARRALAELAVTSRILALMGGALQVAASGTRGYAFRLVARAAPAPVDDTEASRPDAATSPAATKRRQRVLYIEDNAANQKLVRVIVGTMPGVDLQVADTAERGLHLARTDLPALILLDIGLPDRSGLDLLPDLRSVPGLEHVPVLGLSANATPTDSKRGLDAGLDGYIAKPIDVDDLRRRLLAHLGSRDG
jgi:CheY-like chemotaxis protein